MHLLGLCNCGRLFQFFCDMHLCVSVVSPLLVTCTCVCLLSVLYLWHAPLCVCCQSFTCDMHLCVSVVSPLLVTCTCVCLLSVLYLLHVPVSLRSVPDLFVNHNISGLSGRARQHPSKVLCTILTWRQVHRVVDLSMKSLGHYYLKVKRAICHINN